VFWRELASLRRGFRNLWGENQFQGWNNTSLAEIGVDTQSIHCIQSYFLVCWAEILFAGWRGDLRRVYHKGETWVSAGRAIISSRPIYGSIRRACYLYTRDQSWAFFPLGNEFITWTEISHKACRGDHIAGCWVVSTFGFIFQTSIIISSSLEGEWRDYITWQLTFQVGMAYLSAGQISFSIEAWRLGISSLAACGQIWAYSF